MSADFVWFGDGAWEKLDYKILSKPNHCFIEAYIKWKKKKKKNVPVNIMTMSIGGISIAGP